MSDSNLPPRWFDWLESVRTIRETAKGAFADNLRGARQVAEDIAALAYGLYRMRDDQVLSELIKLELRPFQDKSNLNDARACVRYMVNSVLEPQDARTAMNLLTEIGSAIEYLEILENTEGWEPYPLKTEHVLAKIKEYDPEDKGRALYNLTAHYNATKESDFHRQVREKNEAEDQRDAAIAASRKIDGRPMTVQEVRKERLDQNKANSRNKRRPRQIKRLQQIAEPLERLASLDGGASDCVRFAFQVGSCDWVLCDSSLRDHIMEGLMSYQPPQ
jgi:hypothetical protein